LPWVKLGRDKSIIRRDAALAEFAKRDWSENRIYRGGGIGKILGGKLMRVLRRVVR